jgi:endonuclease YncB( thermonuclease family)
MKALTSIFIVVGCLASTPAIASEFMGKVVRVIDGDSIAVMHGGKAEQVRLNGVDCPEKGQAYGKRVKQVTSALAFGQNVTVDTKTMDRMAGRWLKLLCQAVRASTVS